MKEHRGKPVKKASDNRNPIVEVKKKGHAKVAFLAGNSPMETIVIPNTVSEGALSSAPEPE
jgi:hypothetical protein